MPVPFPVVLKGVRYSTAFPPMTSNTEPAGYIARSLNTPTQVFGQVYYAFDGNGATWTGAISEFIDPPLSLEIEFPTLRKPTAYLLRAREGGAQMPPNWRMTASDDGVSYTVLDTRISQPAFTAGELRSYPIATPIARRIFRWEVFGLPYGSFATLSQISFEFVNE